ncbi:NAD(P)-binding domain containing protein [Trema orientale]|uniref:NAD(P)-binding domain containing protein n=1 Tax=Trema orientale TaxID=63057 RepID=A0A2P5CCB4_TREOI|nr:NAD(P)-binding domain containing protein [Trema orientale]
MAENIQYHKGSVCVTGATGFVASWLIMRLLQQGYSVRATVRPESGKKDLSFLTSLIPTASSSENSKLQIFQADLRQPESFATAIEGCVGVFHVAHPVVSSEPVTEEAVTKMTVKGTLGILKACLDSKTVKRVVYTSSAATVVYGGDGRDDRDKVEESTWSDIDFYKSQNREASTELYMATKVKTEKAALEFAEKHGLDVVTLIPSLVVGPFICPHLPASVGLALTMIFGNNKALYKYITKTAMVHIDDVARAHIFLLENPNAEGRYICSSDEISLDEMALLLSKRWPNIEIPTEEYVSSLKEIEGCDQKYSSLSSEKLLKSGFEYKYGLDDMFDGAIQSCKEKCFL